MDDDRFDEGGKVGCGAGTKRSGRITPKCDRDRLARESFASSVPVAAFARERGINYKTLMGWRASFRNDSPDVVAELLRGQSQGATGAEPAFVECVLSESSAGSQRARQGFALEVELRDGTVLRGADPSALIELTKALRC